MRNELYCELCDELCNEQNLRRYVLFLFEKQEHIGLRSLFVSFFGHVSGNTSASNSWITYDYCKTKSIYWNFGEYLKKYCVENNCKLYRRFCCCPYFESFIVEFVENERLLRMKMLVVHENVFDNYEHNSINEIIGNEYLVKMICSYLHHIKQ